MANKKYINVKDVVELTGHSLEDIRKLASTGVLPAHKTRRGHWRLNVDAVEKYFDIQNNNPKESDDKQTNPCETRLIMENHYQEVIERIRAAKSSIKIMTGDFKRFKLKPTAKQGKNYNDGTPLIKYLMEKAKQGKSVQIICSKPSFPFLTEFGEVYKRMNPKRFDVRFCLRNHAKVIIIDDKLDSNSGSVYFISTAKKWFKDGEVKSKSLAQVEYTEKNINKIINDILGSTKSKSEEDW